MDRNLLFLLNRELTSSFEAFEETNSLKSRKHSVKDNIGSDVVLINACPLAQGFNVKTS